MITRRVGDVPVGEFFGILFAAFAAVGLLVYLFRRSGRKPAPDSQEDLFDHLKPTVL
jgi:hypothetical protein